MFESLKYTLWSTSIESPSIGLFDDKIAVVACVWKVSLRYSEFLLATDNSIQSIDLNDCVLAEPDSDFQNLFLTFHSNDEDVYITSVKIIGFM